MKKTSDIRSVPVVTMTIYVHINNLSRVFATFLQVKTSFTSVTSSFLALSIFAFGDLGISSILSEIEIFLRERHLGLFFKHVPLTIGKLQKVRRYGGIGMSELVWWQSRTKMVKTTDSIPRMSVVTRYKAGKRQNALLLQYYTIHKSTLCLTYFMNRV